MAGGFKSPRSSTESAKDMAKKLPFKVGQVVEAKSFLQGYRGAWFECMIVKIDKGSRNQLRYKFKYVHFPEEPLHWSQAYQQRHRGQVESTELMLRPLPPPILHEKDARHATYDGIVVVLYAWEVGDLVNWWCDDVWWEATVTEIIPNGKVKIDLLQPPLGEGGVHVARALELRPALLWSNKDQWTLPISKIGIVDEQLSGQVKQLALASPPLCVSMKQQQTRDLDDSYIRTVPCLEVLRRAAQPLVNTTDRNHMEGNLCDLSPKGIGQQGNCTNRGTFDDDSEDISNALLLKWQQFRKYNRKFMMYRKNINRAVDSDRRRRFKRHIFSD